MKLTFSFVFFKDNRFIYWDIFDALLSRSHDMSGFAFCLNITPWLDVYSENEVWHLNGFS